MAAPPMAAPVNAAPGMSGWMEKKGYRFTSWKHRFFVYDPDTRTLRYGSTPTEASSQPLGVCSVTGAFDVCNRLGKRQNRIDVDAYSDSKGRYTLSVSARSAAEKEAWFNSLATETQRQQRDSLLQASNRGRALLHQSMTQGAVTAAPAVAAVPAMAAVPPGPVVVAPVQPQPMLVGTAGAYGYGPMAYDRAGARAMRRAIRRERRRERFGLGLGVAAGAMVGAELAYGGGGLAGAEVGMMAAGAGVVGAEMMMADGYGYGYGYGDGYGGYGYGGGVGGAIVGAEVGALEGAMIGGAVGGMGGAVVGAEVGAMEGAMLGGF